MRWLLSSGKCHSWNGNDGSCVLHLTYIHIRSLAHEHTSTPKQRIDIKKKIIHILYLNVLLHVEVAIILQRPSTRPYEFTQKRFKKNPQHQRYTSLPWASRSHRPHIATTFSNYTVRFFLLLYFCGVIYENENELQTLPPHQNVVAITCIACAPVSMCAFHYGNR